jgi:hypothetical protein
MRHRERRKRAEFLTEEEIEALFLYEFEAEISKYCATEFDKRLNYVFKAPEILEKAWKMPWKEGWQGEPKPVLTTYGDNLDVLSPDSGERPKVEFVD